MGSASEVSGRARIAGLVGWPAIDGLDEDALEVRLYPVRSDERRRPLPAPTYLHTELRRKGVTLALLHVEYLERHPDGYGYTQFCAYCRRWVEVARAADAAGALCRRQA